jgi:predicted amidophosphoribosyltransferase
MPFCPKCWKEYPKDFIECNVCNVPLTEEKPEAAEHEHHLHEKKKGLRKLFSFKKTKK